MTFSIDHATLKDVDSTWLGVSAPEVFRDYLGPTPTARGEYLTSRFQHLLGHPWAEVFLLRENSALRAMIGIERLDWDSEHFDIACARLSPYCLANDLTASTRQHIHEQLLDHCVDRASKKGTKLLQRRLLSSRQDEIRVLERLGFRLADNVVTLTATPDEITAKSVPSPTLHFRHAAKGDLERLVSLTRGAFPYSRFVNDPLLSKEKGHEVYIRWLARLFNQSLSLPEQERTWILVCCIDDQIVGYVAFQVDEIAPSLLGKDLGTIELIVVDSKFRGLGIGQQLLIEAANLFSSKKVPLIETSTWMNQKSALASNQKAGFKVKENLLTFYCYL